ncbi:MAG: hypothetical protein E6G49_00745 [Actinobacteria bacterium]|nr:MAG: hypothetical protein E6G49_00745 [Actinomycetota bacterium]
MTIDRTWIPRRRRAASRTAIATASFENESPSKTTSTLWYSTSSTPSGSGVTTFTVSRIGSCWRRRYAAYSNTPKSIHPAPTSPVLVCRAITITQAAKVPSAPSTAVIGISKPNARKFSGGFHFRSRSG